MDAWVLSTLSGSAKGTFYMLTAPLVCVRKRYFQQVFLQIE
jgi:hypothetical protein